MGGTGHARSERPSSRAATGRFLERVGFYDPKAPEGRETQYLKSRVVMAARAAGKPSRYADLVLADKPVAYWRLNDTGTTALNSAPGAQAARLHGTVEGKVAVGQRAQPSEQFPEFEPDSAAAGFSGKGEFIRVKDPGANSPLDFSQGDSLTLEAWVNANSLKDGQQVYISEESGEVVQYTTTATRIFSHLGAIPHWLYYTPIRVDGQFWTQLVIWLSAVATATTSTAGNRPPVVTQLRSVLVVPVTTYSVVASDPDGDALHVSRVFRSPAGDVTLDDAQRLSFLPSPGFVGAAEIRYEISDGRTGAAQGVLRVVVPAALVTSRTWSAVASF